MKFKEFTFGGSHHSSSYFRAFILQQNVFKLFESTKLLKEPSPSLTQLSISCEEERNNIITNEGERNNIITKEEERNNIIENEEKHIYIYISF
ncbi:hypothetical protein RIR_jg32341.t1 [Rhizophagus irregularis DAOM 181602=DAOM 197198]|nr:hypothetical protein RIR_jg32341.t1 [Rhizophagus irregularis DAOM 181602=DAOM 197198]